MNPSDMKPTFQRKLFRLFLILSIVPIIVMTLGGYYLATDIVRPSADQSSGATQVTDYYNNYLFDRILQALDRYLATDPPASGFLDFVFRIEAGRIESLKSHKFLPPDVAQQIALSGNNRPRGFIDTDRYLYQFVRQDSDAGVVLYAGIVHEESYAALLETLRREAASQSTVRRLQPRYLVFVTILFSALSVLTIAAAYFLSLRFSKGLARPLRDVTEASLRIAEGDFRQTIKPAGVGEVRALITGFNQMAKQLDQTTTRLAQTERIAAWREVARRFAHELKNPLQPLLISLYRIEKQLIDTDAYDDIYEPLRAASEEAKHLTCLAERFSHLAKLPPPSFEKIELGGLLSSVKNLYGDQLAQREFVLTTPTAPTWIEADAAYLREALHNLLQNAIDATERDGRIELRLTVDSDAVSIAVSDSGTGMDPSTLSRSRQPYFTTKHSGTGLGLAIVEKSVNEMRGRMQVDSSPGQGTTVTITLATEA